MAKKIPICVELAPCYNSNMDELISKKIDDFFSQFKHQSYKKGEILIRADDIPSGIFYLKEGLVKKYAISKKGDELIVNVFKPVSFFPMSWAINDSKNDYFYEAITELTIWKAPKDDALVFVKKNPDVLFDLLSRVYRGTDGMQTRMTYLMAGNAYARLITELLIQVKRFGEQSGNEIVCKTSEKDIASQSGMTRETVSREMKVLKDKGLLKFSKNILRVQNIQKLEDELSEGI
jgi:CRP-like cAMP-binding protein